MGVQRASARKRLRTLNFKSPQFGQPPAGFGCNEDWFCSLCRLPSVSFSHSLFLFLSLLSTVDGTDNRSLPGDLALKHYPSCWQQYSSRVLKWRKYHVLHIDKLLLQALLHCVFLSRCTTSFSLLLTEQLLKKQVMSLKGCQIQYYWNKNHSFHHQMAPLNPYLSDRYWSTSTLPNNSRNTVIQVNRQLLAVCHPGCICPCKNKTVHRQVWTRGKGWDIWWRKEGKRTRGGRECEGRKSLIKLPL